MKILNKIIPAIVILLSVSCNNWLDIKPETQATSDQLFELGDGYRTVLNGLYKKMGERNLYGTELQFALIDCMSKQYKLEMKQSGRGGVEEKYFAASNAKFNDATLVSTIEAIWKDGYNIIANANNLIQNITKESVEKFELGEMERDLILGEAYACRAFIHFDLLRLFAPAPVNDDKKDYIPYVDIYPNIQADGIAVTEFLNKVMADLDLASKLTMHYDTTTVAQAYSASGKCRFQDHQEYGWDANNKHDDFFRTRGYRLSYYAIEALRARVYQYAGMDDKAFESAKKLLEFKAVAPNETSYDMFSVDNFDGLDLWSKEPNFEIYKDLKCISSLVFGVYNKKSYEDNGIKSFFLKKSDGMNEGSWLEFNIDGQSIFKNSQDSEINEVFLDLRSTRLVYKVNDFKPISAKWYPSDDIKIRDENITIMPIIRATEMRYIMAECYAKKGQWEEAYKILNDIRRSRSADEWNNPLKSLITASTMEQFLTDLIGDAKREWMSEGQLFYLYKRLNANVKIAEGEIRPLNRAEYLLPIPDSQNL